MMKSEGPILQSLEIAGFKSFGARKKLKFSDGITAIVGPNGSGKSNVADALRWVLGEQRTSKLRGGKSEELIFHGTDNKSMASLAEVTLVLNNSSGKFGLPTSEIEISRRLYRSGESDYRLNGRKVNFAKVEELLSIAGIGRNTYAVVGQGMIEQLLTMGGKDRKMLFEEAAGVRQFEIRRASARRKLVQSATDLDKVSAVIDELSPNLTILQQQANVAAKQVELTKRYDSLKNGYVLFWQKNLMASQAAIGAEIAKDQAKLKSTNVELAQTRQLSNSDNSPQKTAELTKLEAQQLALEQERAYIQQNLAIVVAEAKQLQDSSHQVTPEMTSTIEQQIADLNKIAAKLDRSSIGHSEKVAKFDETIKTINLALKELSDSLLVIRKKLDKNQNKEYYHIASGLITTVRTQLRQATPRPEIDKTMLRLSETLQIALSDDATELVLEMNKLQVKISSKMAEREDIVELQTKEIIRLRSIELDMAASKERLKNLESELVAAQKDLAQSKKSLSMLSVVLAKQKNLEQGLSKTETSLSELQSKLANLRLAMQQPSPSDTFTIFERLVSQQKTLELRIENGQSQLSEVIAKQKEVSSLAKEWFGAKLPKGPTPTQPVSLEEIHTIASELSLINEIDQSSLQQASELGERVEFLQSQKDDLLSAIADSEKFISKLELESKARFVKNFEKLNTQFQKYFDVLFGGGVARLHLNTKDDFGVDIITTPPGKRTQSISALSGGEKSLASLALLAAILTSNPSPFIFLDEVDAALDDDNSSRFNLILKDLARHSQIVVITHNHETMQAARNLFGITASQKGDSEVLSLQLSQADELAFKSQMAKPVDKATALK